MSNAITLTIPNGYERITTAEDMQNCTHVLLDGKPVKADPCVVIDDKRAVLFEVGEEAYEPFHENAVKHFICLKKREPKRVETLTSVAHYGSGLTVIEAILDPSDFPEGSQVKLTIEEVI